MKARIVRGPAWLVVACWVLSASVPDLWAESGAQVLIVMDEREQMETLAKYLRDQGSVESTIVDQAALPSDWSRFRAVIGYIHQGLAEQTELRFIEYTENGGRLIVLHHTISSGKARNKHFFHFLGIELTDPGRSREPTVPGGHYAWRDPVEQVIVNLQPDHYVTTYGVTWPEKVPYWSSDEPSVLREYPALVLRDSEVYVNHKFTDGRAKTVLLGFQWTDDRNGQSYRQDRTAWYRRRGRGWIFYFQPGHSALEFRNPVITQIILNAILWQPTQE